MAADPFHYPAAFKIYDDMLIIMSVGRMFYSDFGLFYQIPMKFRSTLFHHADDRYLCIPGPDAAERCGYGFCCGFYQSIVGFILVLTANMIVRKVSPDDAMF